MSEPKIKWEWRWSGFMHGYRKGENVDNHSYAIQKESDRSYALLTFTRFRTLKNAKAYAEELEANK
jgi:hypothetical protein